MRVSSLVSGARQLGLNRALLLYEDGAGGALASVHDILQKDSQPVLGPGRPLTRDALIAMSRELAGQPPAREIIPGHILYADGGRVVWYRKAERRPVFFHTGKREFDEPMKQAHALYPPLLFLAEPGNLFVWALASDERPEAGTPVYQAPFLNIYDSGHMCAGTMKLPLAVSLDVAPFERGFFETTFTHSNLRDRLTRYKGGHDALWLRLKRRDVKPLWDRWLVPRHGKGGKALTVADVVNLEVRAR